MAAYFAITLCDRYRLQKLTVVAGSRSCQDPVMHGTCSVEEVNDDRQLKTWLVKFVRCFFTEVARTVIGLKEKGMTIE